MEGSPMRISWEPSDIRHGVFVLDHRGNRWQIEMIETTADGRFYALVNPDDPSMRWMLKTQGALAKTFNEGGFTPAVQVAFVQGKLTLEDNHA